MHPALLKLMRLQARAVVRRIFRGAKTVRGAIFLVMGLGIFMLWMAGTMVNAIVLPRADPQLVRMYFPLAMFTLCATTLLTTAGERAVAFFPAEVDFLFPGPFSRRQLLGYKILRSSFTAIFTATLFSFLFLRFAMHWIGGWIAIFLALIFIQLLSMAVVLIGQTLGERLYTRGRKFALFGVAILVALTIGPTLRSETERNFPEIAQKFMNSLSGKILLAPFSVFGRILTADQIRAVSWIGVALAMIAMLLVIVLWLDAQYLETAASTGQKVYDRVQRIRRGGGISARATSSRLRIPMLPRLGGAGAIAWRQLITAMRTARTMLIVLLLICLGVGPMFYFGGLRHQPEQLLIWIVAWLTFMLSNILRFDFRGDIDQIDTLKAMPVPSWSIVTAELIAPVVVLTTCQAALVVSMSAILRTDVRIIFATLLFALPVNAMLIAVENLTFLIFPSRIATVSPGDLQGMGRQMLVFLLKFLVLIFALALAGAFGGLAWWMAHRSNSLFFLITWFVLTIECIAMIPLLVVAYGKFDPSVDTPA